SLTAGQWQTVDSAGNRVALVGTIENVTGSKFDDVINGNSANNLLRGGAGDDKLVGGPGDDILLGEAGDDSLVGSDGRDRLLGGSGADRLVASSNDDILIGGTTAHDKNTAALLAIQAEWLRTDLTYLQRIADLRNGGGLNGSVRLNTTTVF